LLYVGHVSKENNLPILVNTFRKLTTMREGLHLVVVGDGPYLAAMKEALKGLPATFTKFLDDDELAQAYASSDLFISPSSTDSVENEVLEAQASGVPVIVTDEGEPQKHLIYDITGVVVPANNPDALIDAVIMLTDNPDRLRKMKQDARKYMENRFLESACMRLWESYQPSCNPK
jgi:glycosyltransferase involved in cell wall biosynthesis